MAPEQIRQPGLVDHRADVHALGVILYHMLSGKLPFEDVAFPMVFSEVVTRSPDKKPTIALSYYF
ncbi:MAG: hypothetical protein HY698_07350 [Deltaproteobacteria bacterium]|nr:hypothetical protein [Deltaproteobacteria bacterium]